MSKDLIRYQRESQKEKSITVLGYFAFLTYLKITDSGVYTQAHHKIEISV